MVISPIIQRHQQSKQMLGSLFTFSSNHGFIFIMWLVFEIRATLIFRPQGPKFRQLQVATQPPE